MISVISRKYAKGNECKLSIRVTNSWINNAYALGIGVDDYRWQSINQTLKSAKAAYKRGGNIFIDDALASQLWQLMHALMIQERAGTLTPEGVVLAINEILHKESAQAFNNAVTLNAKAKELVRAKQKPTLIEFIEEYIEELTSGKRLAKGKTKRVAKGTIRNPKGVLALLKNYMQDKKCKIDWDDVTLTLFYNLKDYMVSKNLATNTISQYISIFRGIMRVAQDYKYATTDDFMSSQWSVKSVQVDNIYLTEERIDQLYTANFLDEEAISREASTHEYTEKEKQLIQTKTSQNRQRKLLCEARDIFIMGCLTGQRVSDYKRINSTMITIARDKKFIRLTQQKTKAEIYIPLSEQMEDILNRHDGQFKKIEDKVLAERIRLCGLILGWTEDAGLHEHRRGEVRPLSKKFYECIQTHTARRSFATNAYRRGAPLSAIMAITGHSSEAMLRRYLKLDNEERGIMAAEAFAKLGLF